MKNKSKLLTSIFQLFKFAIVGILNTSITFLIYYLLTIVFNVNYKLADPISFLAGFINSFIWNKFWVFKSKKSLLKDSTIFIIIWVFCYLIKYGLMIYFVDYIKIIHQTSEILTMIIFTVIFYFLNKFITFRTKTNE